MSTAKELIEAVISEGSMQVKKLKKRKATDKDGEAFDSTPTTAWLSPDDDTEFEAWYWKDDDEMDGRELYLVISHDESLEVPAKSPAVAEKLVKKAYAISNKFELPDEAREVAVAIAKALPGARKLGF